MRHYQNPPRDQNPPAFKIHPIEILPSQNPPDQNPPDQNHNFLLIIFFTY